MTNPEGFIAQGGHALTVSRAARRLSDDETRVGRVWREVKDEVVYDEPSPRERLVASIGDRFIAVGTWLKTRSGQGSYQHP